MVSAILIFSKKNHMFLLDSGLLVKGLLIDVKMSYPAPLAMHTYLLHLCDKSIGHCYRLTADYRIANHHQATSAFLQHAIPFLKAQCHIGKIWLWCCAFSRKGIMLSYLTVSGKCHIPINPLHPVSVVFVIIVGIEIRRRGDN